MDLRFAGKRVYLRTASQRLGQARAFVTTRVALADGDTATGPFRR